MAAETADRRAAGVAVPDSHRAPLAPRGDPPAIGAESDRVDVPAGSFEDLPRLAGLNVPDLDGVFLTPGREALAVRTERDVQTRPVDARPEFGTRFFLLRVQPGRVPELDQSVPAHRGEVPAAGTEHDPSNR